MRFAIPITALLVTVAVPAIADPFAQITDRRFRQDIVTMKAAGLIIGPIDSWPMAWAQIDKGLDNAADGRVLAPDVAAAVARVGALSDLAHKSIVVELRANATNEAALARDFNGTAREQFDGSAKVDLTAGNFSANIGMRYAPDQRDLLLRAQVEPWRIAARIQLAAEVDDLGIEGGLGVTAFVGQRDH